MNRLFILFPPLISFHLMGACQVPPSVCIPPPLVYISEIDWRKKGFMRLFDSDSIEIFGSFEPGRAIVSGGIGKPSKTIHGLAAEKTNVVDGTEKIYIFSENPTNGLFVEKGDVFFNKG